MFVGTRTLFAHIPSASIPGGVGLTTALVVFRSGWLIVGSLPTTDGTSATMRSGELIVLDDHGVVRETITGDRIKDRGTSLPGIPKRSGAPTATVTNRP